jgi:rare lipoprotein A
MIASRLVLVFCFIFSIGTSLTAQYAEIGYAAYVADYLAGRPTAYGETYQPDQFTAAHKRHPLGTLINVTRVDDGRSVIVRVNDKGPQTEGFVVDLSGVAGKYLGLDLDGKAQVTVEVVGYSDVNPIPRDYIRQVQLTAKGFATPQSYGQAPTAENLNVSEYSSTLSSAATTASTPSVVRRLQDGLEGYGIQLASYSMEENATRQARALQAQGVKNLYIKESWTNYSAKMYKLIVARFADRDQANQQLEYLRREKGLNGFVTGL